MKDENEHLYIAITIVAIISLALFFQLGMSFLLLSFRSEISIIDYISIDITSIVAMVVSLLAFATTRMQLKLMIRQKREEDVKRFSMLLDDLIKTYNEINDSMIVSFMNVYEYQQSIRRYGIIEEELIELGESYLFCARDAWKACSEYEISKWRSHDIGSEFEKNLIVSKFIHKLDEIIDVINELITGKRRRRKSVTKALLATVALIPTVIFASDNLSLGAPSTSHQIIDRIGYALGYDEVHEQAAWVSYLLTGVEARAKLIDRTDDFRPDPLVRTGSATLADYVGSGYDRGHLAPAGDMTWHRIAMSESFFMSNMSPQEPSFNRGVWGKLEEQVRTWAVDFDSVWVITGPVLEPGRPAIGASQVTVPAAYYKVLYTPTETPRGAGFLLPNAASKEPLAAFFVPIDSVEAVTGLDFLGALPDELEDVIEAQADFAAWATPGAMPTAVKAQSDKPTMTSSVQCLGTTQKGQRCKRTTKDPSGYCYQHIGQAKGAAPGGGVPAIKAPAPPTGGGGQCAATTQKGTRCSRRATHGRYCWQHAK